jgi:hypothetical protein
VKGALDGSGVSMAPRSRRKDGEFKARLDSGMTIVA